MNQGRRRGILEDIYMSIWEPGVNRGVLVLLHSTFFLLICSLISMLVITEGKNPHVWVLFGITVALYATIVWFVREMMEALRVQQKLETKDLHHQQHISRTEGNENETLLKEKDK